MKIATVITIQLFALIRIPFELLLIKYFKNRHEGFHALTAFCGPLEDLLPYYVEPDGQNINPIDKPEDDTGLIMTDPIFEVLDNFFKGPRHTIHTFILSDAGMGKTSLLVMLKVKNLSQIKKKHHIELLKLGASTLAEIDKLNKARPGKTILLLDALDEDPEALKDFHGRIGILLRSTKMFKKVVISCRTQFFPREQEKDASIPGVVDLHGFTCGKIFLSPFDNVKIKTYLWNRFHMHPVKHAKAKQIVLKMHLLRMRPMLLANIELLLDQDRDYNSSFEIYQTMVKEWMDRESAKEFSETRDQIVTKNEQKVLLSACMKISKHLYDNNQVDLSKEKLREVLDEALFRRIDNTKITGRSLLNRTSKDHFRFAHFSILEFFIATAILQGWRPKSDRYTDQVTWFLYEFLKYQKNIQTESIHLQDIRLEEIPFYSIFLHSGIQKITKPNLKDITKAKGACLVGAYLIGAYLERADLERADLIGANLRGANLTGADLTGANLIGANLRVADLGRAYLEGAYLEGANLIGANLRKANLTGANLTGANLTGANLTVANLTVANLTGADLTGADLTGADLTGANLQGANLQGANLSLANFNNVKNLTQEQISSALAYPAIPPENLPDHIKKPPPSI